MSRKEIVGLIIEKVVEIQELSGRPTSDMTGRTRPLLDVPGFDSLNGLELTIMLTAVLRIDSRSTLCTSEDGRRLLRISEMADKVQVLMSDEESPND